MEGDVDMPKCEKTQKPPQQPQPHHQRQPPQDQQPQHQSPQHQPQQQQHPQQQQQQQNVKQLSVPISTFKSGSVKYKKKKMAGVPREKLGKIY